jgi:hypothetical protein
MYSRTSSSGDSSGTFPSDNENLSYRSRILSMLNNNKIELTKFYANLVVKQYNGKMIMISSYMANSKKIAPCLKIMAHMSYNQLLTEIIFLE